MINLAGCRHQSCIIFTTGITNLSSGSNFKVLAADLWGAVCNIHTFVDRSNFGQDRSTFVQQKLLLSDKSNFAYDKSTFVYDKSNFVRQKYVCHRKVTCVRQNYFCRDKSTFVLHMAWPLAKCDNQNSVLVPCYGYRWRVRKPIDWLKHSGSCIRYIHHYRWAGSN